MIGERLLCCVCGESTEGAADYVELQVTAPGIITRQWLGAHAGHLNGALARGFRVEVHEM